MERIKEIPASHFYSKQELIEKWLLIYPNDKGCKDLETNALAGYVLTEKGYVNSNYFRPAPDLVRR